MPPSRVPEPEGLTDLLGHATFVTLAHLSEVAAANDLSLTQLRLLAILRDRRVRMSALAAYLGLDKSSMTGLVDRAEKRGLLTREPNPDDRRATDVLLSPAGVDLAARVQTESAAALSPLVRHLSAAERQRLETLLARLLVREEP